MFMKNRKRIIYILVAGGVFSAGLFQWSAEAAGREKLWDMLKERRRVKQTAKKYGKNDPEFALMHDGLRRVYRVHIPVSYDGKHPVPVVIYVHGGAGDMRAAYMDGLDKFSDKYGFLLLVPQGTGGVKLGRMRAQWNGGKWETGDCCGSADDVGFISRMIDEAKGKFNIDEKRIYATGISNGGLMVNRLGCELSEKIAAIAPVASAAIISDCRPSKPVSIIVIHGSADPANPPDGSAPRGIFAEKGAFAMSYKRMTPYQVVDKWKKINGCLGKGRQGYKKGKADCIIFDQCRTGAEVELCIVEDMGHAYPGGSQYLPENMVGPVSYDMTFDQIWEFFEESLDRS